MVLQYEQQPRMQEGLKAKAEPDGFQNSDYPNQIIAHCMLFDEAVQTGLSVRCHVTMYFPLYRCAPGDCSWVLCLKRIEKPLRQQIL